MAEFKAKVAQEEEGVTRRLAAATRRELNPTQITAWKREVIEKLAKVFDDKGRIVAGHQ